VRVLVVTSEWPAPGRESDVPFLVEQVDSLRQAGLDIEAFSFRGRVNPLRYGAAWIRLRATYRMREFDIVHAHFGQSGLVAFPSPRPVVLTLHGSDLMGWRNGRGRRTVAGRTLPVVSRTAARWAAKVIVVSEDLKLVLGSRPDAEVIPCGIDLDRFRPASKERSRRELGLPTDANLVLFSGHPENPIKRHALALEVVASLDSDVRAQLVNVFDQPHSKMPVFFNACDALLITSQHEGSPTIVKEALACGLPVVSVTVGDVEERIGSVPECRVCRSDRPGEIAANLAQVLRGPSRTESGRQSVSDLDHEVITRKLVAVYEAAASSGRNRYG
jgi:glycosyltransferase involved in cell wall biosynthesis